MSTPATFVVPAGVTFRIADDGLVIENEGDIVLHMDFGPALKSIVSRSGSITVHAPVGGGALSASGDIAIHGDICADTVTAGGNVVVVGMATVGALQAGGGIKILGDANGNSLHAGGSVAVHGASTVMRIDAAGDVSLDGAVSTHTVRATGTIALSGTAKVDRLHSSLIHLTGTSFTARGVQASEAIHVGAVRLSVDALIAPAVHLDHSTSGRATVVESANQLAPNGLKGCFSLPDYAEIFGDPVIFLTERGLTALDSGGGAPVLLAPGVALPRAVAPAPVAAPVVVAAPAPVVVAPAPVVVAAPAPVVVAPEPVVEAVVAPEPVIEAVAAPAPVVVAPEPVVEAVAAPEPVIAPAEAPAAAVLPEQQADSAEATEDPVTPANRPLPAIVEQAAPPAGPEHPLHGQLLEAITRIHDTYATDGDAAPPAVNQLMTLIRRQAYDEVRAEITGIWSELLKHHQKKGMRIQHQVTTTFNTINSLVKKM